MKQLNNICVYIYICRCGKHPAVQVQADHPGLKVQDDRVTFQVEGFQRQIRVPQEASTLRQAAERLARFVEAKDAEQKNLSLLKRTAAESHMTLFGQKKYYIYKGSELLVDWQILKPDSRTDLVALCKSRDLKVTGAMNLLRFRILAHHLESLELNGSSCQFKNIYIYI